MKVVAIELDGLRKMEKYTIESNIMEETGHLIGECGETTEDYKYGGQFDHSIKTVGTDSMESHVLVSFNNGRLTSTHSLHIFCWNLI